MGDIMVTAPAAEPVSVAELRAHLRDVADADSVLTLLIQAAREYFEESTGLIMVKQIRRLTLDGWPIGGSEGDWWDGVRQGSILESVAPFVELPRGPLIAVDHVKTYAADNTASTMDPATYAVETGEKLGRIAVNPGSAWPLPGRTMAGVEVQYQAGYANAAAVPSAFKIAILQIAAHWYENRELVDLEGPGKVPMQAGRVIQRYRVIRL